ncbi:type II secretion system F family protein [Bremerella cremea]|uniref:Pilus assembly protein PilC n=1 Tax=Blastopirellula marina TaxID=124 RepID=A0A2S8FDY3_9BACT|nr:MULTISPECIES: type II secretion system F family protein [Pirellulaceae]PQO30367.1 pilus assembly protein PilC [Blastopirellula marina]RCS43719.1 type II secretion system F family protein [Bremerella cremea]
MPDFAYVARNLQGQKVAGKLTAQTEGDVLNSLMAKSLFPIEVKQEKKGGRFQFGGKKVSPQLAANFYSQLASLVRSGVPLMRSLNVLYEQASNEALKGVLEDIRARVEEGEALDVAMARHPRAFNDMAVNMVKAGAEGGFLEDALERVAAFTEEQEDLKGRTVSALAYPIFLAVVGSGILTFLLVFFVPRFEEMFARLRERGQLPPITDWLLWFSGTLNSYGLFIAIGVVGLFFYLRTQLNTETGKRRFDYFKIKVPLFGGIMLDLAVARFCRVLGTMLKNGVPILRALEISREAAGNRILATAIEDASENISSGESLAAPLSSSGYFPKTVVEMISVAEESNSLDRVLIEIADSLERRTSRRLDLAVRFLEPMMLLAMAGVVLVVVIALLLPVFRMSGAL